MWQPFTHEARTDWNVTLASGSYSEEPDGDSLGGSGYPRVARYRSTSIEIWQ